LDLLLVRNAGARPAQLDSLVQRLDAVFTTRRHGLVLALRHGVPALAVDPVAGAGKVSAQAHAWQWPALVAAESVVRDRRGTAELQDWWRWSCRRRAGSSTWRAASASSADELVGELLDTLEASALKPP
jgi:hypothetical protein